jgi:predicted RNase H-like HicB family nuclease
MPVEYKNIIFRIEIFREGDSIVSVCPELNVSSFGDTIQDAKESLSEAIALFLEECERMGTLEDILEECGFSHTDKGWITRKPIEIDELKIGLGA